MIFPELSICGGAIRKFNARLTVRPIQERLTMRFFDCAMTPSVNMTPGGKIVDRANMGTCQ